MQSQDGQPPKGQSSDSAKHVSPVSSIFTIPQPIKALFDRVPILTYEPNELPQRCLRRRSKRAKLYVFSNDEDAAAGKPSFNPSCLKWQTCLKIAKIDFDLVPSNNHASPTGVLPFLVPSPAQQPNRQGPPIASNRLLKYIQQQGAKISSANNFRLEAYKSLVDLRIRNAWLYTLYLEPTNFDSVASPRYIIPTSSNPIVRLTSAHHLRVAAEDELLKQSKHIDAEDIYNGAEGAFAALSTLLGDDEWFFGGEGPSLFDASVFAYTHLLLDTSMLWEERRLCRALEQRRNLVDHHDRMYEMNYSR